MKKLFSWLRMALAAFAFATAGTDASAVKADTPAPDAKTHALSRTRLVVEAVDRAKEVQGAYEAVQWVEQVLHALQKGEPPPSPPANNPIVDGIKVGDKYVLEGLTTKLDRLQRAVAALDVSTDVLVGPSPSIAQLTGTREQRRAVLADLTMSLTRLDARHDELHELEDTLRALRARLGATRDAVKILADAFAAAAGLAGWPKFREYFEGAWVDMALILDPKLVSLDTVAGDKAKAVRVAGEALHARVDNLASNIQLLLDAERATLENDTRTLEDKAKELVAEHEAIQRDGAALEQERPGVIARGKDLDQRRAQLEAARNAFDNQVAALQRDAQALEQLRREIEGMVYRLCPSGNSFETCTHEALKAQWVAQRNARVAQYNQRAAQLQARSDDLKRQQQQLQAQVAAWNQDVSRLNRDSQQWDERAKKWAARRDALVKRAEAHVDELRALGRLREENANDLATVEAVADR